MRADRKVFETIIYFEPWDWNNGKARLLMPRIKEVGGKYYSTDKGWHIRNKAAAEEIISLLHTDNQIVLDGTEHYAEDFLKQFDDLP